MKLHSQGMIAPCRIPIEEVGVPEMSAEKGLRLIREMLGLDGPTRIAEGF